MVRTSMCWQIGKTMQHRCHAPTLSEDEEHCWSLGQGESGISDDPVLFAAGSGEVRWDHIFKFHMASGWLRRFSAFSLQEWIWTLVQKKGKIWKMTRILADGTQALAEASSNSSDQGLLICFWRPEPCFYPFLQKDSRLCPYFIPRVWLYPTHWPLIPLRLTAAATSIFLVLPPPYSPFLCCLPALTFPIASLGVSLGTSIGLPPSDPPITTPPKRFISFSP